MVDVLGSTSGGPKVYLKAETVDTTTGVATLAASIDDDGKAFKFFVKTGNSYEELTDGKIMTANPREDITIAAVPLVLDTVMTSWTAGILSFKKTATIPNDIAIADILEYDYSSYAIYGDRLANALIGLGAVLGVKPTDNMLLNAMMGLAGGATAGPINSTIGSYVLRRLKGKILNRFKLPFVL